VGAVSDIKVLFFDVGGVLLTNGWDRHSRRRACEKFGLDWEEFQDRHDFVALDFETGNLTITEYLGRTVFYRDRDFSEAEFVEFMKAQSVAMPESLALVRELSGAGNHLLATLNNESRELNDYRIETFGLRDMFSAFFSSSYLGMAKPHKEIYRIAVEITQFRPDQCAFIDDRALNLECADLAGIRPIHFTDATQLRSSLRDLGVAV
jgi:putative hydrolase of the HAD superfamily